MDEHNNNKDNESSHFAKVLIKNKAPVKKEDMQESDLVVYQEDDKLTVFWIQNGRMVSRYFYSVDVQSILDKLKLFKEESNDLGLINDIANKFNCKRKGFFERRLLKHGTEVDELPVLRRYVANRNLQGHQYENLIKRQDDPSLIKIRPVMPPENKKINDPRKKNNKTAEKPGNIAKKIKVKKHTQLLEDLVKKLLANDPNVKIVAKMKSETELKKIYIEYMGNKFDLMKLLKKADINEIKLSEEDFNNYTRSIFNENGDAISHLKPCKVGCLYDYDTKDNIQQNYTESIKKAKLLEKEENIQLASQSRLGEAHFGQLCALNIYTQENPCNGMNAMLRHDLSVLSKNTVATMSKSILKNSDYYRELLLTGVISKNAANQLAHENDYSNRFEILSKEVRHNKTKNDHFKEKASGISTAMGDSSFVSYRLAKPRDTLESMKRDGRISDSDDAKITMTLHKHAKVVNLGPISSSPSERELLVIGDSRYEKGRKIGVGENKVNTLIRRPAEYDKNSIKHMNKSDSHQHSTNQAQSSTILQASTDNNQETMVDSQIQRHEYQSMQAQESVTPNVMPPEASQQSVGSQSLISTNNAKLSGSSGKILSEMLQQQTHQAVSRRTYQPVQANQVAPRKTYQPVQYAEYVKNNPDPCRTARNQHSSYLRSPLEGFNEAINKLTEKAEKFQVDIGGEVTEVKAMLQNINKLTPRNETKSKAQTMDSVRAKIYEITKIVNAAEAKAKQEMSQENDTDKVASPINQHSLK